MKKAESLTGELCVFLSEAVGEMLLAVRQEKYELAAKIRDDIESRLEAVRSYLIVNSLTTLTPEDLTDQLQMLKYQYIEMWEDLLEVDRGDRLYKIYINKQH